MSCTLPFLLLYPLITSSAPTSNEDTHGYVPQPTERGTIGILWSCILTLTICLWTSLHLNIPSPTDTSMHILRRKLRWMFIGAIAPESLAIMALNQRIIIQRCIDTINSLPESSSLREKWTLTDGFYLHMGGLVLSHPSYPNKTPIHFPQLIFLIEHHYITLPNSASQEIMDKSKADAVVKGLVCLQACWLLLQCIARAIQHLPLTTLELSTMAYVFFTAIVYASLWHKPLDVRVPTTIVLDSNQADDIRELLPPAIVNEDDILRSYLGGLRNRSIDNILGDVAKSAVVWGTFIFMTVFHGAWHCIAWNFFFASYAELWLWRACSVLSVVLTPLSLVVLMLGFHQQRRDWRAICLILGHTLAALSLGVRLMMLVEIFIGLRRLPVGAFEAVRWTSVIPHF